MTVHQHAHPHDDPGPGAGSKLDEMQLRVRALESILIEKGYVDPKALDFIVDAYETKIGPHIGARIIAKAWVDPQFKRCLIADATEAVSEQTLLHRTQPLSVPTTCIYSKTDGIVAWQCCTSVPAPETENVEVHSSHLGYGHNVETLSVIADRLAQPEDCWRPFQR